MSNLNRETRTILRTLAKDTTECRELLAANPSEESKKRLTESYRKYASALVDVVSICWRNADTPTKKSLNRYLVKGGFSARYIA